MSSVSRSKSSTTLSNMLTDEIEGLVRRLIKTILNYIGKLITAEHLGIISEKWHKSMTEYNLRFEYH